MNFPDIFYNIIFCTQESHENDVDSLINKSINLKANQNDSLDLILEY